MRVRIVCFDENWILGKFGRKLHENLQKLGVESDIATFPDPASDINHYIIYSDYNVNHSNTIDTLMVTHIDRTKKKDILAKNLHEARLGICMSAETMLNMANLGIPREKLCYVNPAHDGVMFPKQKVVGITCRVQTDGRKREDFLSKLAKRISPMFFAFKIMGDGWQPQVDGLINAGFKVDYYPEFDYEEYTKLIPCLDYYLYMGQDEGQMGFIDALAAGVETIVTPQGYHLDAIGGICYAFNTFDELAAIFDQLAAKRQALIDSVATWNWLDYAKKHLEIWQYCIDNKNNVAFSYQNRDYHDGINSILEYSDNKSNHVKGPNKSRLRFDLFKGTLRHKFFVNIKKNNKK
jgi:hypothetical protein